jgi:hypothetical protein
VVCFNKESKKKIGEIAFHEKGSLIQLLTDLSALCIKEGRTIYGPEVRRLFPSVEMKKFYSLVSHSKLFSKRFWQQSVLYGFGFQQ